MYSVGPIGRAWGFALGSMVVVGAMGLLVVVVGGLSSLAFMMGLRSGGV